MRFIFDIILLFNNFCTIKTLLVIQDFPFLSHARYKTYATYGKNQNNWKMYTEKYIHNSEATRAKYGRNIVVRSVNSVDYLRQTCPSIDVARKTIASSYFFFYFLFFVVELLQRKRITSSVKNCLTA